jgi:peptidoglycan hydrolase CwlO-like protein
MSTAGKVLVVLVMLASIACLILAGGVAQLNANANKRLLDLSNELAKAREDIEAARREAMATRDETTETQERIDRQVATLRARQNDLERSRSQIVENLTRLQYDLGTVNATIDGANTSKTSHGAEFEADDRALAELRGRVQALKDNNAQLMDRLKSLRQQFQDTYHKNVEMLGKAG